MANLSFMSSPKLAEALRRADPTGTMHVRILDANTLALGSDPFNPTTSISFATEAVHPLITPKPEEPPKQTTRAAEPDPQGRTRRSRQSGRYLLDFKGRTTECRSLQELLAEGLKAVETYRPGTLEKLSEVKPRTKRIVARDPALLFEQAVLVEKYAERLMEGWWYGTNNSADETQTWLQRAAELAGLTWNKDISTSL